ncbi:hypothetical protein AAE02nite_11240 [Adhaeribacter aerolatus]|uniref:Uncharacterized protein n=1 Tax=Adhaeribacter aerolatus TaxID=670289 RepID=A0A512AUU4_9BACT|nr:hypothetical protein [Adhaeribacter aerolatus]GEO03460.1 hypothetical protein AAE02nite_11240 [Adhaeribacter aerolatus]
MATLLIQENVTDIAYIFGKLADTVESHSERYPELMYITAGLELVKKQSVTRDDLAVLLNLSNYIKDNLSQYLVARNLNHKLQQELELVKAGISLNREEELYLNF